MRSTTASRRWRAIGLAFAFLALVSCGGGGGGGGASSAPPGSKLFITDGGNHAIASIINAAPTLSSTFTVDRTVAGSATGLGTPGGTPSVSSIPSIALDGTADRLFASTQLSVAVFDNARPSVLTNWMFQVLSTHGGNPVWSPASESAGEILSDRTIVPSGFTLVVDS